MSNGSPQMRPLALSSQGNRLSGIAAKFLKHATKSRLAAIFVFAVILPGVRAQTIEDGIMIPKSAVCSGTLYTHDAWDHYWEGTYNRTNGNLGTVTTQTMDFTTNYGVFDRLNVIGTVPYVWTYASQGVLHGQEGFQDLTLAVKYELIRWPLKEFGTVRFFPVVFGSIPLTSYDPDFQPMSIGLHAKTIAPRATLNFQGLGGLYVNGSAAYVFRGNVTLDRNYYYTDSQLFLSNQVAMPNQFDYVVSAGYRGHGVMLIGNFAQQQTRGGGDIRPQDLPFVSNRMNFSKAGASAVLPVPLRLLHGLQYWFTYSNTFDGRNVGESNTFTSGLMYQIQFHRRSAQ
ncbi:conserved hypothetical protein [Candidatus Sulfotelmatomonas gaucii]|uniref:Uncharacterized protein n=1 Tax=Candidatus Sulfuritelmatomonas gaucii TaxID=2043161 RepID=A0A2N9L3A0_9BACT|nr:conserved hypothetical protein [Candidatus Sulfotelmatomonas gaucii]